MKVQWTSIRVMLPKGTAQDWIESQLALNTLGYQLKAKRHKSSLWGRINQGNSAWYHKERDQGNESFYYEILVPGLKERQIDILKDLGYYVRSESNMSKQTRRSYYAKVKPNEYFTV